jgi:DNA (cytosine-5)-methyltransferase 1
MLGSGPYRTAAECIDFDLPVPSIFMSPGEAKAWGKAHGVPAPRRPLADATLRRIARGVQRYVLDSAEPFIVPITHRGDDRVHSIREPLRTITTSERGEFALVAPYIAKHYGDRIGSGIDEPLHTVMASGAHHALVTPMLMLNSEMREDRIYSADEPVRTLTAANARTWQLVAPTLIQTSYGERKGQAPRTLDLFEPLGTIVGGGVKHSLVAAFLAKHNGGHEATGQHLTKPTDTIVCRENKALVSAHLMKLYGTCVDGQAVDTPMPTVTAYGNHIAAVYAFLAKYYGQGVGQDAQLPLGTATTRDRFALVTVAIDGEEYAIVDIGMRMLTPRELFRAQGFPDDYVIDRGKVEGRTRHFSKATQTRLVGNSVPPHLAAAIIGANLFGYEATA